MVKKSGSFYREGSPQIVYINTMNIHFNFIDSYWYLA